MHIHILGICGTFMGGIAQLARAAGHRVTGCDANVYPPMSTQLEAAGIALTEGYAADQLALNADLWVIGNAISRGNPLLEAILERGLPYVSGPQWLADNILQGRWVLAVAGTHGKTTTTAMLAWILDDAGLSPGFLVGGVPQDFGVSARLAGKQADSPFFVIEADEYDTAFCDKRSKFVHYRPRTAILNNLEYDHADIFPDLAAIETQFHHLVRTIPGNGLIVANAAEASLERVLAKGCWTPVERFAGVDAPADGAREGAAEAPSRPSGENRNPPPPAIGGALPAAAATANATVPWQVRGDDADGSLEVLHGGRSLGVVRWALTGAHNRANALAALVAARHAGVPVERGLAALARFQGVKRRLEVRGTVRGVTVYDDFAHHPTAIATTVAGLRRKVGAARILAVLEPRSNTMKLGTMKDRLPESLADADRVFCYAANLGWDARATLAPLAARTIVADELGPLVAAIVAEARTGDHVLVMSNGGFGGIHGKLLAALAG